MKRLIQTLTFSLLALALVLGPGCRSNDLYSELDPPFFEEPIPGGTDPGVSSGSIGRHLQVGEKVLVTFSDVPAGDVLKQHEQRIREDGSITLPYSITVKAAGKTHKQLEDDIRQAYVPKLYLRLTVTVKTDERVYFVDGEVELPGRQPYLGQMTVLRAIGSAGGFTDFADRKKILLNRSNGERSKINWYDAQEDASLDLEVFPGDRITVPKRFF